MTFRELALLAGVSRATVSKVFSGSREISAETAEYVRRIAEQNGFVPPKYRRAASGHTVFRVAILVREIESTLYSRCVAMMIDEMRQHNMEPDIRVVGFTGEELERVCNTLAADNIIDGIIATLFLWTPYSALDEIPKIICADYNVENYELVPNADYIVCDMENGIRKAFECLRLMGHTHIGFIGENNSKMTETLFRKVAVLHRIPVKEDDIFVSSRRFAEIGVEAADYFLWKRKTQGTDSIPTAFLCAYDEVALGAIAGFRAGGVRVPEEISFIGINDIELARYAAVPLTSLRVFSSEMVRTAIDDLEQRLCEETAVPDRIRKFPCELVFRESVGRPGGL